MPSMRRELKKIQLKKICTALVPTYDFACLYSKKNTQKKTAADSDDENAGSKRKKKKVCVCVRVCACVCSM
jgi:hypothetical protein